VAEEMKAPLFTISAGELGTDSGTVQLKLDESFEIATAWKAVILLDEADIFLEKRTLHDLQRNQLVSIFLQSLEYYTGTIFLTTNRVNCIDPAFNSRIHMSLPYPELSMESRRKVWTNFLNSLKVDTQAVDEKALDTLAALDLNGRQIKNVVKMAGLLAIAEGGKLTSGHIDTVAGIVMKKVQIDQDGKHKASVDTGTIQDIPEPKTDVWTS
jgi:SpoVK/Ycf46/Vps4 family AAA+-type ATPase